MKVEVTMEGELMIDGKSSVLWLGTDEEVCLKRMVCGLGLGKALVWLRVLVHEKKEEKDLVSVVGETSCELMVVA